MVQVLLRNVPQSYPIHFGKRLTSYIEVLADDGHVDHYILNFADGTTAEADVLIGADGIRSPVRMSMYDIAHRQDCSPNVEREHCPRCTAATPKWTGIITYRALIPTESLRKINPEHQGFQYTLCVGQNTSSSLMEYTHYNRGSIRASLRQAGPRHKLVSF